MSLSKFALDIHNLHARVAQGHGRIEITRDDCDHVCVLISRAELEGLERALEILSQTPDFRQMSQTVESLATASVAPVAAGPA